MKTFYKSGLLLLSAMLLIPAALRAEDHDPNSPWGPDGVVLTKSVTRSTTDLNRFNVEMEAYVTGQTTQSSSVSYQPADIVLVIDASGQMSASSGESYYVSETQNWSANNLTNALEDFGILETNYYFLHTDGKYYKLFVNVKYTTFFVDIVTGCSLYYTVNGVNYYLRPDSFDASTTEYTVEDGIGSRFSTLYKGSLYKYKEISKLESEVVAAGAFIEAVYSDAVEHNVDHKISIVKFAGSYRNNSETSIAEGNNDGSTQVVKSFLSVKANSNNTPNVVNLKSALEGINASGVPAYSNRGLRKAQLLLQQNTYKNDGAQKMVVLFTGSTPSSSTSGTPSFSTDVANGAIEYSRQMKKNVSNAYGSEVKVFTIGLYDNPSDNIRNYLNGVSSNYPDATAHNSLGTGEDKGYFQLKSNQSIIDVVTALLTKTTQVINDAVTYKLSTDAHIIDYLTADFRIPAGATVTLQTANSTKNNGVFGWASPQSVTGVSATIYAEQNYVDVTGFDFNDNYVNTNTSTAARGKKLIISFPIEIDPISVGGASVPTNRQTSGIYVKKDNVDTQVAGFQIPNAAIPCLTISKTGLKLGESALFNVMKNIGGSTYGKPIQVWVTGDGSKNAATTKVKFLEPGTYKVEETRWSWSYTPSPSNAYIEKAVGAENNTTFEFSNTAKTGVPSHGESASGNNVFSK